MKELIEKALSMAFPPKKFGAIPVENIPVVLYTADPFATPVFECGLASKPRTKIYRDGIDRARKTALAESIAAFENWQNS